MVIRPYRKEVVAKERSLSLERTPSAIGAQDLESIYRLAVLPVSACVSMG